jgi:prophage tail gpP-like protein
MIRSPKPRLVVDGQEWTGIIKSVQVTASMETLAHTFSVETYVAGGALFPFYAFAPAQLFDGDDLLVDGYLEQPDDSRGPEGRSTTLLGKSTTNHLQEAAALLEELQLRSVTLDQIVRKLVEPWKIPVRVEEGADLGAKFKKVKINDGETPFEVISRAAHERGLLVYTQTGAELIVGEPTRGPSEFWFPGAGDTESSIRVGGDVSGLGSAYSVLGHGVHLLLGKDPGKHVATVPNPDVTAYRPIVIEARKGTQLDELVKQANRMMNSRRGKALTCNVESGSWYAPNGDRWWPNMMVRLTSDVRVGRDKELDEEMVTSTVGLRFDAKEGSSVQLEFKRRDAFLAESK